MQYDILHRMKKTENELKAERETKERLTEEKDKLLKSKTTGEERYKDAFH